MLSYVGGGTEYAIEITARLRIVQQAKWMISMMSMAPKVSRMHMKELTGCRFGNFIGEGEESEEESRGGADAYVYDDEAEDEVQDEGQARDQQLMDIDGQFLTTDLRLC
jgi:hypothetical protein